MKKSAKIYYFTLTDEMPREDKLNWFANTKFEDIPFERIIPDKNHNWLNIADNDFDDLLPLANKETKLAKSQKEERAVFKLFSLGIATNRDDWVYSFSKIELISKVKFFIEEYKKHINEWKNSGKQLSIHDFLHNKTVIKLTLFLERFIEKGKSLEFDVERIYQTSYRPFVKTYFYFDRIIVHAPYQNFHIFPKATTSNKVICFPGIGNRKEFGCLVVNSITSLDLAFEKAQCLPLYRYDSKGNSTDNITDWGLNQFQSHYQDDTITKENIFHYTYAVLHHPAYRQKYALNLKREFPRLPFYVDFSQWVTWGKQLMDLHLNYEKVKKYRLKQIDIEINKPNKPKLKADKQAGKIDLDTVTTLQGIPSIAWEYKLGNRSALEWILDQYKEKKPRDKTIAEKFNTYRFANYKEHVIDLLQRVCTVSVETMKIIEEMPE
jgi:predicted helicase